ncbi:MAG: glycoside hydrolase family 13 protein [Oscillospiraceae bacterium]|nr:glycoside hydrolase family 13 protein [Oscillospiraceae bacterium]
MSHIPFQSRFDYHKSPYGAVLVGSAVTLRVIVPRDYGCSGVQLWVARDGEAAVTHPMAWERLQGEGEEWWCVTVSLNETGLYWYHFECALAGGAWSIGAGEKSIGVWGSEERFPLTVYAQDYAAPDWLYGGVLYQIFPDRFAKSEMPKAGVPVERILRTDWGGTPHATPTAPTGTSVTCPYGTQTVPPEHYDFFGGDLRGIQEKLPYLAALGVRCLYLNPIFAANSNHRYDTADYETIDPLLGTEADFTALCVAAKKQGIRVILDGVFSHTGADSVYFNRAGRYGLGGAYLDPNSPYRAWYKFTDYPTKYASWWGVDILPELREDEPSYLAFAQSVAQKWLRLGASGWRLDVADELPDVFLDAFAAAVKREKPDAYLLGEVWEDASDKFSHGVRRRYLQGRQLDSVMNYPLADAILAYVRGGDAAQLAETLETLREHYPPRALHLAMNHIGTHDTQRVLTLLGDAPLDDRQALPLSPEALDLARRRLKLASVLQYVLPGIPCVYYGDEAGMQGGRDPFNRGCFPWGDEDAELVAHYRDLGKLRRTLPLFKDAPCQILHAAESLLVLERTGGGVCLRVMLNAHTTNSAQFGAWLLPPLSHKITLQEEVRDHANAQ